MEKSLTPGARPVIQGVGEEVTHDILGPAALSRVAGKAAAQAGGLAPAKVPAAVRGHHEEVLVLPRRLEGDAHVAHHGIVQRRDHQGGNAGGGLGEPPVQISKESETKRKA